jgi:hypothetical protein
MGQWGNMRTGIWRSHPVIGHAGMEYGAGLRYWAGDWAMKMRMLCKLLRKSVRSYWLRPILVLEIWRPSLVLGGGENYGSWAENSEANKRANSQKAKDHHFRQLPPPCSFFLPFRFPVWKFGIVRLVVRPSKASHGPCRIRPN